MPGALGIVKHKANSGGSKPVAVGSPEGEPGEGLLPAVEGPRGEVLADIKLAGQTCRQQAITREAQVTVLLT